ncbi:phosphotransferase [Actinopolymorpha rutila]|uniref:Scyllo-inosamine 4-kinase n=1 Tax=Actinopolymorpha rutila TaxID=446787 RepID=A0A852Z6T3_9ACTN|nr:scyllo-inosamine 4-kinase [Actinopolymorpha rutila]
MPSPSHPSSSDRFEALAHRLLARYGSEPEHASRPEHSWSNEVWLGQTAVVRISRTVDGSLGREASLVSLLPPDVGYPKVLGQDVTEGLEWMVTERLHGANLEVAWPTLDRTAREGAVTDLWARLEAVHRTDVAAARAIGGAATPFYALHEADARKLLDWLLHNEAIEPTLHSRLDAVLSRMFQAVSDVPTVLSHTDAGPHNTVWDGTNAVPVDFEFACPAPADLDLENVLRTLSFQAGDNPAVALLERASGLMALPGAETRLWGYAVLRDLWGLRKWMQQARAARGLDGDGGGAEIPDLQTWAPLLHLRRHAECTSWLGALLC